MRCSGCCASAPRSGAKISKMQVTWNLGVLDHKSNPPAGPLTFWVVALGGVDKPGRGLCRVLCGPRKYKKLVAAQVPVQAPMTTHNHNHNHKHSMNHRVGGGGQIEGGASQPRPRKKLSRSRCHSMAPRTQLGHVKVY